MSAYVIAEIEITDPAAYEEYRKQVPAVVGRYGGKFLVRGASPEYAPLIKLRQKASRGRLVLVEGAA